MFTSGSAGAPKCVMVTHGNLAGLFPPLSAALDFGPDDVWSWFHSASFGFSVWEIFGALLHGACLQVVPAAVRNAPAALGAWIADQGVTVFSQTPSALRRLLGVPEFHRAIDDSRLRYLALSGEALRPEDIAIWYRHHAAPQAPRLLSTYALTETARPGDAARLRRRRCHAPRACATSGQPLGGRHVLVLDAAGQPLAARRVG